MNARSPQLDWIATVPPFQAHSPTSRAAAASVVDDLGRMQRLVLECLRLHPDGLTDEQMQRLLGMNPNTQRPRRVELQRRGLIVMRGTRKTESGRAAVIWTLA